MVMLKQLKAEEKSAARQRQVILELNTIVKDLERCDRTIAELQRELEAVNAQHQGPRDTRQEIAYLSGLLDCAKKKLAWEKQIGSLQKRIPSVLQEMTGVLNDPKNPPSDQTRVELLQGLQKVQAAMERLQAAKPA